MIQTKKLLAASALLSLTTLTAEASLTVGTSVGQSVVYSSISDITWTGDANLLGTMIQAQGYSTVVNAIIAASPIIYDTPNYYDGSYQTPGYYDGQYSVTIYDFGSNGTASWFGAQAFTGYLNSINYAGSSQWTLPSAGTNPQTGFNKTNSQFGQLFYSELGGNAGSRIPNTSYFTNELAQGYWLSNEGPSPYTLAWAFAANSGVQYVDVKAVQSIPPYVWAVSPGNLTAVPVPAAIWLFGSGLIGLLSLRRRCNMG